LELHKILIISFGYLLLVISILPLVRLDHWFFRVFEYPRVQKLTINILVLAAFVYLFEIESLHDSLFPAFLTINAGYLLFQVYPFTFIAQKQMMNTVKHNPDRSISLFIGNVYQYNRKAKEYLESVSSVDPDVIMLVETDEWWAQKAEILKESHPYQLLVPLENTYGMILYSKFELIDGQVKYLVEEGIPSVHACIKLPSGEKIRFHGLHPTPPVPGENPRSTERDKEILLVAKSAKKSDLPVIVAGDLNDVAWSYTTQLFSKVSGLLDPRRGRGFFNTFHAKYRMFRYPLDHIFCSTDFTLLDIQRMPNCGSDHFPMFIRLQYEPRAAAIQEEPVAEPEDLELAEEKINKVTPTVSSIE
jgi:endonuclease/exonuclease/phosphatase (EEP) superfamily protein YafD